MKRLAGEMTIGFDADVADDTTHEDLHATLSIAISMSLPHKKPNSRLGVIWAYPKIEIDEERT